MRGWPRGWGLLAAAAALAGCGYSLSSAGRLAHESIAIPVFANETLEYGLEDQVTRAIVDAFLEDNRLEVMGAEDAETILRGRVVSYERHAYTYDQQEEVQEYRIEVTLDLEYQEVASGNSIWREEAFKVWASYDRGEGEEGEELGKERAIDKVAREVVARTIEGW